jgi:hypothetical protein
MKPATKKTTAPAKSNRLPDQSLDQILNDIRVVKEKFDNYTLNENLKPSQINRLVGVGFRNYGFIEKTFHIALEQPQFVPSLLDMEEYGKTIRDIEAKRSILEELQQLERDVRISVRVSGDSAFNQALMFYGNVREMARRHVSDAISLFETLRRYFTHRRTVSAEVPTDAEIERDVKALLKGTKDGEIIIKNERPTTSGGKRTIVDEVHKGKIAVKKVSGGEIEE